MSHGVLSGVTPEGREHGLERYAHPAGGVATFWLAPEGSTATVEIDGNGSADDVVELQWSELSAQVPSVRAIVMLDGPGSDDPASDFTTVHEVAEDVAVDDDVAEVYVLAAEVLDAPSESEPQPTRARTARPAAARVS